MNFSVLISVYNKENPLFFKEALSSLIHQTLLPSEIVLVKDGPLTEALEQVIERFIRDYPDVFRIVSLEQNGGLGNALKIGLQECRYNWVARMDTDDICLPERFEKQIAFLKKHPEVDVLGGNVEEFNRIPGDLKLYRIMPECGNSLLKYAKFRSPVNHPSIIFRKEAVLKNGGYNGDILLFEDFALFVKMLKNGCVFYNLQEILLYFRVSTGIDTIKRRSGWHYVKSEWKFLDYAHRIGHLSNKEKVIYMCTKIPLRFLPPKMVLFVYNTFLRRSKI